MNVLLRKSENIQNRLKSKRQPVNSVPLSTNLNHENILNERPSKLNSHNLAFHGLSSIKAAMETKTPDANLEQIIETYKSIFGSATEDVIREKIARVKKANLVKIADNGRMTFKEIPFKMHALDTILYPIKDMPLDMINYSLGLLQRVPGFKGAKWLENLRKVPLLLNRKNTSENREIFASLKHFSTIMDKPDKVLIYSHNAINPLVANYDTSAERSVTRFVTGVIPAFFLANDAYNITMYVKDDKDIAQKDKKRRFNQELSRVIMTAMGTLIGLRMFNKLANTNAMAAAVITGVVTFCSETLGRLLVGTPVLPVSDKKARELAIKQGKTKPVHVQNPDKKDDSAQNKAKNSNDSKTGFLTINNVLKASAGLILASFAIDKLSGVKSIASALKSINKFYKSLYQKDYTIKREDFEKILKKLNDSGFGELAKKYSEIVANQKGDVLKLGKTHHHWRAIIIDKTLVYPIRFIWNALNVPYEVVAKPVSNIIIKQLSSLAKAEKNVNPEKAAEALAKETKKQTDKNMEMLRHSIQYIEKYTGENSKTKLSAEEFKAKLNSDLFASLNNESRSSYSNSDLSNIIKNLAVAITSGFLIVDNYNQVMVDSQGEDKDFAGQKAKERAIQRTAKFAYGGLTQKLFNDIFARTFNSSILGAELVNIFQVLTSETLERKSVGLPLGESTQEKIAELDQQHLHAKGFAGDYFRTMAMLTGKKPLSERKAEQH